MGGEKFYFQFFGNVITFEKISENILKCGHQYFSLYYVSFGVESWSKLLTLYLENVK